MAKGNRPPSSGGNKAPISISLSNTTGRNVAAQDDAQQRVQQQRFHLGPPFPRRSLGEALTMALTVAKLNHKTRVQL